ncbi:MAG: hypothetical protein O9336_18745 [Microcystis sp. LE19-98.1E]|nr:hypothetical protein [Brevundimonas sp.]MCZ8308673.1 hypothetical protein [Microcystis sp. LE19-98.1E]
MSSPARSSHAQIEAMRRVRPDFFSHREGDGCLLWVGDVQPRQRIYRISIIWWPGRIDRPHVQVRDPKIRPRAGASFEDIPHLIFNSDEPALSGLCLFDPEGREWSPADLIADTTVPWACEWLHYYELWHMTGEWRGPSVGYHTISEMREAEATAIREAHKRVG